MLEVTAEKRFELETVQPSRPPRAVGAVTSSGPGWRHRTPAAEDREDNPRRCCGRKPAPTESRAPGGQAEIKGSLVPGPHAVSRLRPQPCAADKKNQNINFESRAH